MRFRTLCLVFTAVAFTMATGCQKTEENGSKLELARISKSKNPQPEIKLGPNEGLLKIEAQFAFVSFVNGQFYPKNKDITFVLPKGLLEIALFPENGAPRFIQKQILEGVVDEITLNAANQKQETWITPHGFDNAKLWERHAQACIKEQKHAAAKALLKAAIAQFPQHGPLWKLRALNNYTLKRYEAALNAVDRYLELTPNLTQDDKMRVLRQKLATHMDDSKTVPQED